MEMNLGFYVDIRDPVLWMPYNPNKPHIHHGGEWGYQTVPQKPYSYYRVIFTYMYICIYIYIYTYSVLHVLLDCRSLTYAVPYVGTHAVPYVSTVPDIPKIDNTLRNIGYHFAHHSGLDESSRRNSTSFRNRIAFRFYQTNPEQSSRQNS